MSIFDPNICLVLVVLDKERFSGGPGALSVALVAPEGGQAVDLGPGEVGLLGAAHVVRGAVPRLDHGGLESAAEAGRSIVCRARAWYVHFS